MTDDWNEINAVFDILTSLNNLNGLPEEPIQVEMTRENYPSVHPMRRSKEEKGKLDLAQIRQAFIARKWWFIGPNVSFKIRVTRNKVWSTYTEDVKNLKKIATDAGFKLYIQKT